MISQGKMTQLISSEIGKQKYKKSRVADDAAWRKTTDAILPIEKEKYTCLECV